MSESNFEDNLSHEANESRVAIANEHDKNFAPSGHKVVGGLKIYGGIPLRS